MISESPAKLAEVSHSLLSSLHIVYQKHQRAMFTAAHLSGLMETGKGHKRVRFRDKRRLPRSKSGSVSSVIRVGSSREQAEGEGG